MPPTSVPSDSRPGGSLLTSRADDKRTVVLRHPARHYLRRQWIAAFVRSKLQPVANEFRQWLTFVLMHIPGRIGSRIRVASIPFNRRGKHVRIEEIAWIKCPEHITLGDHVRIHPLVFLDGTGGIDIGSHVGVGFATQIYSINHHYRDMDTLYEEQGYDFAKVTIEDDVWIGAGSIILPGVTIRTGTVVAAGSVVTKETEPYSVIAGVPARIIGRRGHRHEHPDRQAILHAGG